ncbi:AAA family ATPase [Micromonospora sp. NPDC000207]|uniref:AAA family ATPase n=1 Tax=Micromonospora sp. NPDC000207 TaxID=3154246 RepID=UPI0033243867
MPSSPARKLRALLVAVVTLALGAAALVWGLQGVEAASWLAGVGSFVVAVAYLSHDATGGGRPSRTGHRVAAWLGGRVRRVSLPDTEGPTTVSASTRGVVEDVHVRSAPPRDAPVQAPTDRPGRKEPGPVPTVGPGRPGTDEPGRVPAVVRVVDGLVGRDPQVRRVLEAIRRDETLVVVGGHGMGKTSFLGLLRSAVRREFPDVVVVPSRPEMRAEPYGLSEAYRGEYGESLHVLVAALLLDKSTQLLGDLVGGDLGHFGTFAAAAESTQDAASTVVAVHNDVQARTGGRISDLTIHVDLQPAPEDPLDRLRRAQRRVDEAFLADWRTFLAGRRAVVILDGFETLIDDAVGQWFVAFSARLPGTSVVLPLVPHAYAEHGRRVFDPDLVQELPRFDTAEAQAFLTHHFGQRSAEALVSTVLDFTGGHPYGLKLVTQMIRANAAEAMNPAGLRRMLLRASESGELRIDDLVRAVIRPERNPDAWRVVEVCSLLHSFDVEMVQTLLDGEDLAAEPGRIGDAVRQIHSLGLLEPLAFDDRYRLHDFVRPVLAEAVRRFRPELWLRIHRRAATYYYDRIRLIEGKTTTAYGSWFKYEDVVWQTYETEWLAHSAELVDERHLARTRFVLLFLEAFWWWGVYVDFSFCRQLLDSWQRSVRVAEDRDLFDELTRFHHHYPTGPGKPSGAHWTQARLALRTIGELCGLHRGWRSAGTPAEQGVRRRAWLYLRLFTAHTYWYDGRLALAEQEYGGSESEFVDLDDPWVLAWFYFEWAEVAFAAGDRRSASARCRRCGALLRRLREEEGEVESELLANLHRLLGDLLHDDDPVTAARQYGQAVLRAFLFQRMASDLDRPVNPPDAYTHRFYAEITARAAARARSWSDRPQRPELVAALVEATAGGVPPETTDVADRTVTVEGLAARLFPRGPSPQELGRRRSAFTDHWGEVVQRWEVDVVAELDVVDRLAGAGADG